MNTKAIVVYVDDSDRCLEEFTWLHKTWLFWDLNEEYDIVVFCNPNVISKLPKCSNLVIQPLEPLNKPGTIWQNYGFVNSFAMFNDEENVKLVSKYDYILKSDCDVFLTNWIKGLNPSKALIGQGGYMEHGDTEEILNNIKAISKKFKLRYSNMNHIGASIFAKTEEVTAIVKYHFQLTKYLLQTGWKAGDIGQWPGWYKGVASMYAIHITINHFYGPQNCTLYAIDSKCWDLNIEQDVYHIHAWHAPKYWSKMRHFEGQYEKYNAESIPTTAQEYCHWVSTNSLEEMLKIKNK